MNNEQPLVSVIIPCYNVGTFVEKAITSILQQTYTNLEIWIVDDASEDDTLQRIYSFKDERINVVEYKQNTKKIGAVNEVLQKVNGDLIAFQDADDWSEPERIEYQVAQFYNQVGLGICFTNYRYVSNGKKMPVRIAVTNEELRDEFLDFGNKKNIDFDPTNCPAMMITREVLKITGGYHPYFAGRVAEDIQWIYRILKEFKGITVDKPLYNYSIREGSFTQIQFSGQQPKYAYSWQLLSKIIYKDIHENIDVLDRANIHLLKELELEACEEVLTSKIRLLNEIQKAYETSMSFKIGKFILSPFHFLKQSAILFLRKFPGTQANV